MSFLYLAMKFRLITFKYHIVMLFVRGLGIKPWVWKTQGIIPKPLLISHSIIGGQGDTWDSNNRRNHHIDADDGLSEVSASAANVANDGKHPLLEFAMRYFREGKEKFDEENPNGSLKDKKKAKKKKSGASDADWTWKDRIDMVKWTDRMITVRL